MIRARGQARPAGRHPRSDGDPILPAPPIRLLLVTALVLLASGFSPAAGPALAQTRVERTPQTPQTPEVAPAPRVSNFFKVISDSSSSASRDSLLSEIRRYSVLIEGLRDSLQSDGDGLRISPEDRARLERSVGDFTRVVERIGRELSRLELQVRDNKISLVDEAGEGIVITIPEDIDERISEGFSALSEIILSELPDTVRFDAQEGLTWLGRTPRPPKSAVRVVQGNLIKVRDDLLVPYGEAVRGNVVVVFGSTEIRGRVDGNVVVVFGNLQLTKSAEVSGRVVTVGGRLDQHPDAEIADVFVFDPFGARRGFSPFALLGHGVRGFLVCQVLFLFMLVVAVVGALAAPKQRFRAVIDTITAAPGSSFGIGVLAAIGVQIVGLVLIAVLVLTVIGIPLALLVWLALVVVGVVATAVAAAALGERICRHRDGGCPSRWVAVVVGMTVLHAVSFTASFLGMLFGAGLAVSLLSVAGFAIKIGAYVFGVGALAASRIGTQLPAPTARPGDFADVSPESSA